MSAIVLLRPGDEERLDAFLRAHADSSLFLRANLRAEGLADDGRGYQGPCAALVVDGAIRGVAMHYRRGALVLQAPEETVTLARAAVRASGRPVAGLIGPWEQVLAVRQGLRLEEAPGPAPAPEDLFALDLAALAIPDPLRVGKLTCRLATTADLPALVPWRYDYSIETLGRMPGEALQRDAEETTAAWVRDGALFVLEESGRLVSMCAFNARIPDCVQIGGVWTPAPLRGRGHGRAIVAGALLSARSEGVPRSVLFTEQGNVAARTAYLALGYRRVGDYGMLLFDTPQSIG